MQKKDENWKEEVQTDKKQLTEDEKTLVGEEKLQEALRLLLEEDKKTYQYFKELEDLSILHRPETPPSQRIGKEILLQIAEDKKSFFSNKAIQKEVLEWKTLLSKEQKELTGKAKLQEALRLLEIEQQEKLEKKIQKSLKRFQRHIHNPFYFLYNTGCKKILISILGIALILVVFGTPNYRFILSKDGFFSQQKEVYTSLWLPKTVIEDMPSINTYYEPSYIPDGYKIDKRVSNNKQYSLTYTNKNENTEIIYRQSTLYFISDIDNKESYRCIKIDGKQIYFHEDKINNNNTIIYYNNDYIFEIVSYNSAVSLKDFIKILDSLKPVLSETIN